MKHDIFISYSREDKRLADIVYEKLESLGFHCWIDDDIPPGEDWVQAVVQAIKSSRFMVLIYSKYSKRSTQVERELTVASNADVHIVPLNLADTPLEGKMEFFLSNTNWLNIENPPTDQAMQKLAETLRMIMARSETITSGENSYPEAKHFESDLKSWGMQPDYNSLVIGLGGTGVKTLRIVRDHIGNPQLSRKILFGLDTLSPDLAKKEAGSSLNADNQGIDYYYAGGDYLAWACDRGNDDQLTSNFQFDNNDWFDADYFCSQELEHWRFGTGGHRQMGRLALMYHMREGSQSPLMQRLGAKMAQLARKSGSRFGGFRVIIISSTAGGTGSGMMIDMARIVKMTARELGFDVKVYGLFVLPQAFSGSLLADKVFSTMELKSFSAIRELSRISRYFSGTRFKIHEPFPFREERLFFHINLFGARNSLMDDKDNIGEISAEKEVYPVIASWIVAMLDGEIQHKLENFLIQREMDLAKLAYDGLKPPLIGALGSYSVVLPVKAIVEGWTNSLAFQILEALYPVADVTREKPGIGVLEKKQEISDEGLRWWETCGVPVAEDIGHVASSENSWRRKIVLREMKKWLSVLMIASEDSAENMEKTAGRSAQQRFFEEVQEKNTFFYRKQGFLQDPLKGAMVQRFSPRDYGGSKKKAADSLVKACNMAEQEKLSSWSSTLDELKNKQLAVFQERLLAKTAKTLNGGYHWIQDNVDIGLLRKVEIFLETSLGYLQKGQRVFGEALEKQKEYIQPVLGRLEGQGEKDPVFQMQRKAGKQKDYLEMRQILFEFRRWKLMCETELDITSDMAAFVEALLDEMNNYIDILSTGDKNLESFLGVREEEIDRQRMTNPFREVQEVINDAAWEEQKYQAFSGRSGEGPSAEEKVIGDFYWEVKGSKARNQKVIPTIKLEIQGPDEYDTVVIDNDRLEFSTVTSAILDRCRREYESALETMNVVDYLAEAAEQGNNRLPHDFADRMINKCGVLLRADRYDVETAWRRVYLHSHSPGNDTSSYWLENMYEELGGVIAADRIYWLKSNDPTRLTVMIFLDYLRLTDLPAFHEGVRYDFRLPGDEVDERSVRRRFHIYEAEQKALEYEDPSVGQRGFLNTRVVSLLQDEGKLVNYVLAHGLGIIQDAQIQDSRNDEPGKVRKVVVPPRVYDDRGFVVTDYIEYSDGKPVIGHDQAGNPIFGRLEEDDYGNVIGEDFEWWLNDPEKYITRDLSLINTVETFCLSNFDQSREEVCLQDMHLRLDEYLDRKLSKELKDHYLPRWKEGEGSFLSRKIIEYDGGTARQESLRIAVRIELFQQEKDYLQGLQEELSRYERKADLKSQDLSCLKDEMNFIELLLKMIRRWIKIEKGKVN